MKWALIAIACVAILIAIVAVIGALLPRSHVATRQARFRSPRQGVWALMTDVAGMPAWRKDLKSVQVLTPTSWRENDELTLEVVQSQAPSLLVTRIAPGLPFGGTWTYALTTEGDETVLAITDDGEVYNPIFRFVSRFVMGHTAGMDRYLAQLGTRLNEAPANSAGSGDR